MAESHRRGLHQEVGENEKERSTERKKQGTLQSADFRQKSLLFHVNLMYSLLPVEELCKITACQKKKARQEKSRQTPKPNLNSDNVEWNWNLWWNFTIIHAEERETPSTPEN